MEKKNKTEKKEDTISRNDITKPNNYSYCEGEITISSDVINSGKLHINEKLAGSLDATVCAYYPTNALSIIDNDEEIFKIENNGDIILRGKKIGSDKRVAELLINPRFVCKK